MPIAIEFILLAAIWGASFLLMKLGASDFGPFLTAFLRVLLASVFLLPLLAWRGQFDALKKNYRPILFVGMLNSGIPFALFSFAVLHISTGLSSILNATVPLWGALVAWLWLKDRPASSRILGLVIGFAGVAALSWDKATFKAGAASPGMAVLACLLATLCYGIAASYTKKYLTGVPPLASATGSQIGAALLLAVPGMMSMPTQAPGLQAWGAIVMLAFFCTAVAYIMYFRIIERAGPARAVAVTFLIPVFGVAYGAILLSEKITLTMVICGAIIILGTALSTGVLKFGSSKTAP
ncbi:DMT family transporter [Variovorax sp. PCZ-1]|uniref:DMT family transporter n=1 Tax=Variovorax sp. PCZ-1 TaxID=2835533 RepID=UPI001BCB4496|nr:DMT family transporter [Variovorax sp. PCZ-1]MBS7806327.1 DMT family transporter [Variovorax sp. PCZ-1]